MAKLYTPLVIRWARNANIKESEIADVVQEVFQAVAKSISKFESGPGLPPFRGWLWGITRNKINDFFRRTLNQANAVGGTDAQIRILELAEFEPDSNADSSVASEHDSLAARALELMKTDFTETTWKAFWQVTVENKSPAEVSAEIGISIGSVYTAKSRVLARLRNELAGLT
ncbi:MAG: sigma-70 family RNA polymerase sigma factor [Pirellulaceae bacterium]